MASFPDRFHRDNAALLRWVSSFSYILSLAECGAGCWIEPPFHANWGGKHVHMGDYVYANFGLTSFGFDHNSDHNANDFIWSIAGTPALIECLRRLA